MTSLLKRWNGGDHEAAGEVIPRVYQELHRIASSYFRGERAVTLGTLRRTWTEGGRRYFHYATDAPIKNHYAIFSADPYHTLIDRRMDDNTVTVEAQAGL